MKLIFKLTLLFLIPSIANAQTVIGNTYINDELKISFKVDSNWQMSIDNSLVSMINKNKSELITFEFGTRLNQGSDVFKKFKQNDILAYKAGMKNLYEKKEKAIVISVEVKKNKFLHYDALTSIAFLKGQNYLGGIPIYKKQINFMLNDNTQAAFIYFIPKMYLSKEEIQNVENQINTFRLFK